MIISKLEARKAPIKRSVLSILSYKGLSTINQLHRELQEKYNIKMSYQAVRKAVRSLVNEGGLEVKNKKYTLSGDWIENMKRIIENVSREYGQKKEIGTKYGYVTVKGNAIEDEINKIKMTSLFKELIPIYQEVFPKHNIFKGEKEENMIKYLFKLQEQTEIVFFFLDGEVVGGTAIVKSDEDKENKFIRWRLKHFAIRKRVPLKEKLKFLQDIENRLYEKDKTIKLEHHMAENEKDNLLLFKKAKYSEESIYLNRYRLGERAYNYCKILAKP